MTEIPRLGYGAANIGNLYRALSDADCQAVLDAAWESGIRYYDTAPHYGLGLSERRLGAFLRTKPRDEFVVSTKVGRLLRPNPGFSGELDDGNSFAVPADLERVFDLSPDGIRRSLDESLERLGLDRVDVLFLHDPEKHSLDEADEQAYPALVALREDGLVDRVGVGSMSIEALERASAFAGLDLLMVAGRLTLAEQPALERVIPQALENDMQVVAAGVFNSGLLATNAPGDRYEYDSAPAELLARARAIADLCTQFGVELPAAALQYTLRIRPVVSVVVGGSRPEQVVQNAQRLAADIPEALWDALAHAALIP